MRRALLLTAALIALPLPSLAGEVTARLTVTASVAADCVVATNGSVDFGSYAVDPQARGGAVDVTAEAISVACTRNAPGVTVGLGDGKAPENGHRGMTGPGTATVAYDIYTSQERSTVWNQVNTVAYAPASNRPVLLPLYGRIPAGQSVAPGRYSDVLLAMVNF